MGQREDGLFGYVNHKQILVKISVKKNSHNLENKTNADGITEFSTLYLS